MDDNNVQKGCVYISTVDLTVRVDEPTKREFDAFCNNVGLNATTAVNMFIKAVVRTRTLPFAITDSDTNNQALMSEMRRAISSMRGQSERNGNSGMGLDEINAEINASRLARRAF